MEDRSGMDGKGNREGHRVVLDPSCTEVTLNITKI